MKAKHTGMIILGGGLIKHHICNANLMVKSCMHTYILKRAQITDKIHNFQRNGADFSVFLNTASEFDGSDSGARPDEALSWGKIRKEATPVKVSDFSTWKKRPSQFHQGLVYLDDFDVIFKSIYLD